MEKRTFEDPAIVAFLQTYRDNINIAPRRREDGMVVFDVSGPRIEKALDVLYSNIPVPILDYIKNYKSLRSCIFSLKNNCSPSDK